MAEELSQKFFQELGDEGADLLFDEGADLLFDDAVGLAWLGLSVMFGDTGAITGAITEPGVELEVCALEARCSALMDLSETVGPVESADRPAMSSDFAVLSPLESFCAFLDFFFFDNLLAAPEREVGKGYSWVRF